MLKSKQKQAFLAISLLIASLLFVYVLIIFPALQAKNKHNEEISNLQFQTNKITQRILKAKEQHLKKNISLPDNDKLDKGFVIASSVSMAKATLQQTTSSLVKKLGGTLVSTHVTENNEEKTFPELFIQLHIRADIESLQKTLFEIEKQSISFFVNSISIQKIKNRSKSTAELDIRLKLSAHINTKGIKS